MFAKDVDERYTIDQVLADEWFKGPYPKVEEIKKWTKRPRMTLQNKDAQEINKIYIKHDYLVFSDPNTVYKSIQKQSYAQINNISELE